MTRRRMTLGCIAGALFCLISTVSAAQCQDRQATRNDLRQPLPEVVPDVFVWTDTCNVYVLRDGEAALLIDLGDGSVLDHLGDIGVQRVEWVLFTHHHREQCQGAPRLKAWHAARHAWRPPEAERALFERPADFRKLEVRLGRSLHDSRLELRPTADPAHPARPDLPDERHVHLARTSSSGAWTRPATARAA